MSGYCKEDHIWHCEDDAHFYYCICTKCGYEKEWLLK